MQKVTRSILLVSALLIATAGITFAATALSLTNVRNASQLIWNNREDLTQQIVEDAIETIDSNADNVEYVVSTHDYGFGETVQEVEVTFETTGTWKYSRYAYYLKGFGIFNLKVYNGNATLSIFMNER
ncbi:MAG: hypothetical protein ACOZAO_00995 [Patescibacteria group bacterium]